MRFAEPDIYVNFRDLLAKFFTHICPCSSPVVLQGSLEVEPVIGSVCQSRARLASALVFGGDAHSLFFDSIAMVFRDLSNLPPSQLQNALDGPAMPPPDGMTPDFVHPSNNTAAAVGVISMLAIISTVFFLIRLNARIVANWRQRWLHVEDGKVFLRPCALVMAEIEVQTKANESTSYLVLNILGYVGQSLAWCPLVANWPPCSVYTWRWSL